MSNSLMLDASETGLNDPRFKNKSADIDDLIHFIDGKISDLQKSSKHKPRVFDPMNSGSDRN